MDIGEFLFNCLDDHQKKVLSKGLEVMDIDAPFMRDKVIEKDSKGYNAICIKIDILPHILQPV